MVDAKDDLDIYRIWEGQTMPFHKEHNVKEYEAENWETRCVFNVTEPTLTVYPARENGTDIGVIILPGGGYTAEAIVHEGHDVAQSLADNGITAAVLKYRLPNPKTSDQPHLVPLTDTRRALKLLRQMADQYGLNKNKIGLVGFSAGSHLATVAGLWKTEDMDELPNFSGLIYGVTNLSKENLKWLEDDLYFRKLTDQEIVQNRLLDFVTKETPPAFLVHAYDDDVCLVEESTLYAQKLFEHNVPVEMHLFPQGGHGFGLGRNSDGTSQWLGLFVHWLNTYI